MALSVPSGLPPAYHPCEGDGPVCTYCELPRDRHMSQEANMDTQCDQTRWSPCHATSRWVAARNTPDGTTLYLGEYCERHAVALTTDRSVSLRPTASYADVVSSRERERLLRAGR